MSASESLVTKYTEGAGTNKILENLTPQKKIHRQVSAHYINHNKLQSNAIMVEDIILDKFFIT